MTMGVSAIFAPKGWPPDYKLMRPTFNRLVPGLPRLPRPARLPLDRMGPRRNAVRPGQPGQPLDDERLAGDRNDHGRTARALTLGGMRARRPHGQARTALVAFRVPLPSVPVGADFRLCLLIPPSAALRRRPNCASPCWRRSACASALTAGLAARPNALAARLPKAALVASCVVPDCDGASLPLIRQEEDALWQAFFTAAPARRRIFEPSSA